MWSMLSSIMTPGLKDTCSVVGGFVFSLAIFCEATLVGLVLPVTD